MVELITDTTFLNAIRFAAIGKKIGRKDWAANCTIVGDTTINYTDIGTLHWTKGVYSPVHLLGDDVGVSLTKDDLLTEDWFVIA